MKKIIIIGAGPAGLTAAYALLQKNVKYEIVLLEAEKQVGGISKTINVAGNRMDLGGHRFFTKSNKVNALWEEWLPLDKNTIENNTVKNNAVMLKRRRISRIYYKNHFYDYPLKINGKTVKNIGYLQTMRAGCSYLASCIHKRKEDSLENFYCNRFGRVLYTMFFEGYTKKLWGRHPRDISADWGAQRVKGLSVYAIIKDIAKGITGKKNNASAETSLIEEFCYPPYGPGQLWDIVEDKIKDSVCVEFGCVVTKIHFSTDRKINCVTYLKEGKEYSEQADFVLSSMPLKDLVAGFTIPIPKDIDRIAKGLPYRDFITIGLLVPSLKVVNQNKKDTYVNPIHDCWIYVQDSGVKLGRIQIFNNWSPYMVKDNENTTFLGLEYFCTEKDEFWNQSEEECVKYAVNDLEKIGILEEDCDVLLAHREKVKKAYPAYFDTYQEMDRLVTYLDGIENLYCIGRNGQHRYNNMDHSMLTALEAVENIVSGRKDKANIWEINTEKRYHESR